MSDTPDTRVVFGRQGPQNLTDGNPGADDVPCMGEIDIACGPLRVEPTLVRPVRGRGKEE